MPFFSSMLICTLPRTSFIALYTDANGDTQYSTVAEGTAIKGEWVQLANQNYLIPADATNMQLYVETAETTNNIYIDEVIGAIGGTGILGAGEAKDIIPGDVDFDGAVNVFDLCIARKGILNGFDSKAAEIAADVNQDEATDITDIQLIQDFLLKRITEFPIAEKPVETTITMEEYTAQVSAKMLEK